jgi:hypothetical protein
VNFLQGHLVLEGGRPVLRVGAWGLPLPARWMGYVGQPATLGLRAEDVEVAPPGAAASNGGDGWAGELRAVLVEPAGSGCLVTLEGELVPTDRRTILGCHRGGVSCKIREGERVAVHVRLDRAHLFDRVRGTALRPNGRAD